jgi:tetratricopeptide (TPR) repeat protein
MTRSRRAGRINVKALVILVAVFAILVVGAIGARQVRRRMMAKEARLAGLAALDAGNLEEACLQLKRYLNHRPDDVEMLERYASARLAIRPRTQEHVGYAIAAYRRVLRHRPHDDEVCDRLARLYLLRRQFKDVEWVCRHRLEGAPGDLSAKIDLAQALLGEDKPDEAAALLEPVLDEHPEAVEAYALYANALLHVDESEEAVDSVRELLDACVEKNPDSVLAHTQRARFHRDSLSGRKDPDPALARADLEAAGVLHTDQPHVILDLANEWAAAGEPDRAADALARVSHTDVETLVGHGLDPDKFLLEWHLINASIARQRRSKDDMVQAADEALAALTGGYRSAYLETAMDLYLEAGEPDKADQVMAEYREIITGVADGSTQSDDVLAMFAARIAYARNKPYEAINELEPLIARSPDLYAARRLLAQCYVVTGQSRRAIRSLERCVQKRPADESAKTQLVKQYLRQRRWGEALQQARTLGRDELDSNLLRIESSIRGVSHDVSRPEVARRLHAELTELRNSHRDSSAVRMLLAALAEFDGRPDDAVRELEKAIEECSDSLDPAIQLAQLLRRLDRLEDAIEVCRAATERHRESARPWILRAEFLMAAGRPEEARAALDAGEETVRGQQQHHDIAMARARLHLRLNEREKAIAKLKAIADSEPNDIHSRLALLELPEVYRDPTEAQPLVEELKAIEGPRSGIHWRLQQARVWLAGDEWRAREHEVVDVLTHCIEVDPEWSRPVLILGRMYERLNDFGRAEEVYRRLLEVRPDAIAAVDRLLRLLERHNRLAEAKEILNRLPSDLPGLTGHRVDVATATGEFDTAIEELRALVASDPRNVEARILLARLVYLEQRNAPEAFRLLDEAAQIDPDALVVHAVRALILRSEGEDAEAQRVLDEQVAKRGDFAAILLRARFHALQGRFEFAEEDYRRLTELKDAAAGYELLGRFYMSRDRVDDAIATWEQGLEVDPNRTSTRRMLMKALVAGEDEQRRSRGREMLEDLLASSPDDADLLTVRARLVLRDHGPEATSEARRLLNRAVQLDSRAATTHLMLIRLEASQGNLDAAAEAARRALGYNPGDPDLLMAQAELARARGDLPRAQEIAEVVLGRDPDRADAYALLADIAFVNRDPDTARSMINEALLLSPNDLNLQLKRAAILELRGEAEQAIDYLTEFVQSDAGSTAIEAILVLAELCCRHGDHDAYERWIQQAEALRPDAAGIIRTRFRCLATQRRFDQIPPLLSQWRARHPDELDTVVLAATLLIRADDPELQRRAEAVLEDVVEVQPERVDANLALAQVAYVLGELKSACAAYRQVLKVDPDHDQAINDLAWVLAVDLGDPKSAIELADRGVQLYLDDAHMRDTRGVVLTKLGRLPEAVEDLELAAHLAEAHGIHATHARALMHLAEALQLNDKSEQALDRFGAALEIDREHNVLNAEERARIEAHLNSS